MKFGDLGADLLNGDIPLVNLLNGLSFLSFEIILLLVLVFKLLSFLTSDKYLLKFIDSVNFLDSFILASFTYFEPYAFNGLKLFLPFNFSLT